MAESAKAKKAVSAELTEKQKRFRRLMAQGAREGAVIGLIVLCIYLAMALFTFSPSDPGWASIRPRFLAVSCHDCRLCSHAYSPA